MRATQAAYALTAGDVTDIGTIVNTYWIAEVNRRVIVYMVQQKLYTMEVANNCIFTIFNAPTPQITEDKQHSSPMRKTPPV